MDFYLTNLFSNIGHAFVVLDFEKHLLHLMFTSSMYYWFIFLMILFIRTIPSAALRVGYYISNFLRHFICIVKMASNIFLLESLTATKYLCSLNMQK